MKTEQKKDVLEKNIEKRLLERVEASEGMCIKLYTLSIRGLPDRLIIMPKSRFYLVETKRMKKGKSTEPSPSQRTMHKKLERLGVTVWIVNDAESLDHFITYINIV